MQQMAGLGAQSVPGLCLGYFSASSLQSSTIGYLVLGAFVFAKMSPQKAVEGAAIPGPRIVGNVKLY